jgi:tetratricopeptide (TPR) repeat protein/predicted Ser/Thr protein kinase
MGEVFKAWDPDLERHVALKYLKHDDPVLVERLMREARAQARVDHPSVGKVYEVGEDDGRPFIAMEFVDGEPLDDAAAGLPLEHKVLLVKKVAEAIQAAHAAGLVHRDLKPANILVADDNGEPHPYVLDFGIARIEEVAGLTMTGQVIGTPGYLSPEQARGDLRAVDRRTDVFSLGVVLYELLAETRPFTGDSNVEILVHLMEADPPALRSVKPEIPKDLETVVMTCLEKEPERRYPSARALAEDLGRFLHGEPVEARPVGLAERVVRKARRNPFTAAAVSAAVLALLALVIGGIGGWVKYTRDLERERDVAEANAAEAREISDFLIGVFSVADPEESHGEMITAREILDRGAERIDRELADRPETRARLLGIVGEVHTRLGLHDRARPLLERSLELTLALPGTSPEAVIEARVRLADLCRTVADLDRAEEITEPIPALIASSPALDPRYAVQGLGCIGRIQIERGRITEAGETLSNAVETARLEIGPEAPEVGDLLNDLCYVEQQQRRWDRAIADCERALEIRERAFGPDDPRVATTLNSLANAYRGTGRLEEAAAAGERVLELRERILGPDHPRTGTALNNLGLIYKAMGRLELAEALYLRSLDLRRLAYGEQHPKVGRAYNNLAFVYHDRGDLERAEAAHRSALAIYEATVGPDHPDVYYPVAGLGRLAARRGDYPEAERYALRCLRLREAADGADSPSVIGTLRVIGEVRIQLGDFDGAERSLDRARRIAIDAYGESSDHVGRIEYVIEQLTEARNQL